MLYPNLRFPKKANRPFFYTNFVSTVDGKIQVLKNTKDYWPIGSKTDYQTLLKLRSYADCLIHGKNTAKEFGGITLQSLNKPTFKNIRRKIGKDPILPYYVVEKRGDLQKLAGDFYKKGYKNVLVEGGPHLLGSFLKENLIDEIFLTIAPKIFGNTESSTLTLVEGVLFPKKSIKKLSLLSVKKVGNELFLRYKVLD